jgi:GTPase SAR1 family protein
MSLGYGSVVNSQDCIQCKRIVDGTTDLKIAIVFLLRLAELTQGVQMAAILVNPKVFERLKQAYSEKFGASPSSIRDRLDRLFEHERVDEGSIISDKTIRNFFKEDVPPKTQEKNLNYLCSALLDCDSYQDAVQQFGQIEADVWRGCLETYRQECIEQKCGTIRVPDMTEPRSLKSLYTTARISEDLRTNRRKSAPELMAELDGDHKPSRLAPQQEIWVEALEVAKKYSKLMIWGKAGAGKTTFLKYLALHFLEEDPDQQPVPVFISLKSFAEDLKQPSLLETLIQEFTPYISEHTIDGRLREAEKFVIGFLEQGKGLILLDGFDEVLEKQVRRVYKAIENFITQYPQNRLLITCRFGAKRSIPTPSFKEVEIVDFNRDQIDEFVEHWFENCKEVGIADKFIQKLDENPPIEELATNPLLLTMLCSIYDNGGQFPKERIALYDDATDLLLRKWDSWRRIDRDSIYKGKLTQNRRKSLFAQIAYRGFSQRPQRYFWQQRDLDTIIRGFIQNIPGVEAETLDVDSQEILNAIEYQHGLIVESAKGIYSYSHLIFQEYFTACYLWERIDGENFIKETIEKYLASRKWRQIWVIFVELVRTPESTNIFLIEAFRYANSLARSNELQKILTWLDQTTEAAGVSSSSWRACYLNFDFLTDLYINRSIEIDLILAQRLSERLKEINKERNAIKHRTPKCQLQLDLGVIHASAMDRASGSNVNRQSLGEYDQGYISVSEDLKPRFRGTIDIARELNLNELADLLFNLQSCKPSKVAPSSEWEGWAQDLRSTMIEHLGVGYAIELSKENTKDLEKHLYSILLIVECLQGDIVCSPQLRDQIIDCLLLPNDRIPEELR